MIEQYDGVLLAVGLLAMAVSVLPGTIRGRLVTLPVVLIASGVALFALPILEAHHPLHDAPGAAERLTELAVIIALTGTGLKIDRPLGWRAWSSTWRLLAITMPLSIAGAALLGWWAVGLAPATALLMGAVIAPTDPVLAGDLQTGAPGKGGAYSDEEGEVQFALTSESSLNDGLAFPFTNAAIAMATVGAAPTRWLADWLVVDVLWRVAGGVAMGWLVGWALSRLTLAMDARAIRVPGLLALAATLVSYGATEAVHAYGFIGVFVTAMVIRDSERDSRVHTTLHLAADQYEHLAMGIVLVLFGGALVAGILEPLTWPMVAVSVALLVVVRPAAGWIGLLGGPGDARERAVVSIFGIRGLGSLYYLTHAFNAADFPGAEELWALAGLTVLLSVVGHGLTAGPVMRWLARRHAASGASA